MPAYDTFRSTLVVMRDAQTLSTSEFLEHPDYPQIASFFLGWVFICSLLCIVTSPVMCHLYQMCYKVFHERRGLQLDANFRSGHDSLWDNSEKHPMNTLFCGDRNSSIKSLEEENHALILLLSFCFAFASVAHFSSLLSFNSNSGASACAFLVALGDISTACARFTGLIIISLDLRKFELWWWEVYLAWSWLFIAGGFVVATCATNAGAVSYASQLDTYLCHSTSYLPTALTMFVMFMTLELYMIGRPLSFIAPSFLEFKHRIGAMTDTTILRALSLLLFDILNLVPGVKMIGIVGEFVPFSIGALIVLAMFQKRRRIPILGEPMPVPMSLRDSTTCTIHVSMPPRHSAQTYIPGHPFAASLDFATTQTYHTSIGSSISSSLYSYNAAGRSSQIGAGAGVVRVASRLKYTQSRPHLLDLAETYISPVTSHGHDGAAEEYTKIRSRLSSDTASAGYIPPNQDDYAKSLERHQGPPNGRGPLIRPRVKITTSYPRQPPAALMSPPISADFMAYRSDIIGASGSRGNVDVAERLSQRSCHSTLSSNLSLVLPLESAPASVVHFHCNDIGTSVPSDDEESWGSEDRHDRWLAFGQSSLSPAKRRHFDDQSLQSFIPQTPPTEQFVTNVPHSQSYSPRAPLESSLLTFLVLLRPSGLFVDFHRSVCRRNLKKMTVQLIRPSRQFQRTVAPPSLVEHAFVDHAPSEGILSNTTPTTSSFGIAEGLGAS
ncbi:hypothetical protein BDR07DRAFT_300186 [Suillus spraguei]|nr:hypothetical protein BDR07DRAFT_300186 [Suillus spraguei]